ncbi:uncharacterized protein LOC113510853 [Galleria mellonella]|uniref:Uncharacterized protein LOC113510853 n=1 Tax=Galleria mellonella TaxID=7137 RepID=A0A6J3BT57_GALME|nr:uncharacterized protein LOC113510853 [Galleria mellonella]
MLISRVLEDGGAGEGCKIYEEVDTMHEYQTASELFDIMARNQTFDSNENEALTTSELIILYENIDIGTKLINTANDLKRPNRHVETIVHNEDPDSDGSDLNEMCSKEDFNDVFLINKERLDLLNSTPSLQNTLCQKIGDLQMQSSDLNTEYDRHFLFKDPYVKEQLKSLNVIPNLKEIDDTVFPGSLLNYICCKRLEDDYNFYMDNIIRYVKHTIDHLKRISNGDYLTEKVKRKWREVERNDADSHENNKKVLATSTSIPLHVERKITGSKSTWDEIVHSEIDVRSLSKILEKKIVVEIPKIIRGAFTLFSECRADNLIISCKQEKKSDVPKNQEGSRIDVLLQLKRSDSGHVISNINSIMILQAASAPVPVLQNEPASLEALVILNPKDHVETKENAKNCKDKLKIIELNEDVEKSTFVENLVNNQENINCDSSEDTNRYTISENDYSTSSKIGSNRESSESSIALREILDKKAPNSCMHDITPDELHLTMQKLSIQSSLPEEIGEDIQNPLNKKKSPTRVRIKSPYENQLYIIEEKKRKRLLEIRERRERKKMALSENCKITKHKYGKGPIMPQPSNSVTKLSITNKSFYNSIYGETIHLDNKVKLEARRGKKKPIFHLEESESETETTIITPDENSKKYVNRSYLDDKMTEMTYMQMKRHDGVKEISSTSTSAVSNDFVNNLSILSQLIVPSASDFNNEEKPAEQCNEYKPDRINSRHSVNIKEDSKIHSTSLQSNVSMVPVNTSKDNEYENKNDCKRVNTSVECRKSIIKLYDLMNNLRKLETVGKSTTISNSPVEEEKNNIVTQGSSIFQGSDSGTSVKHRLTSSNASYFSFDKINNPNGTFTKHSINKKTGVPPSVVPKVIISTKSQTIKFESNKKDKKRISVSYSNVAPENPLKAISQLLHEFDSIQKTKQKVPEPKQTKKSDPASADLQFVSRQSCFKKCSQVDHHLRDEQVGKNVSFIAPRDKRPIAPVDLLKIPHQQVTIHENNIEKLSKKRISDIIDEAKEARGEAVRGPSKLTARLNTLAQPKRSYVQAHSKEYSIKYGRTVMANRLQRLATIPVPPSVDKTVGFATLKNKQKRSTHVGGLSTSMKILSPSMQPLEKTARLRHSFSINPQRKILQPQVGTFHKTSHAADLPEAQKHKKMIVEPHVKNHYGRVLSTVAANELHMASKSRPPDVPNDIDLASVTSSLIAEESVALGSKPHNIVIHTMINSSAPSTLSVNHEITSDTDEIIDAYSKEEPRSLDSDYRVDIFKDTDVLTTVKNDVNGKGDKSISNINKYEAENDMKYDIQPFNSYTELQQLENALHRQLSVGTFNKRLRIKNLTLTPKQSMRQVIVLQSGDASSLVVKTSLLQNIQKTNSYTNNISALKHLSMLTTSQLDWNYGNRPIQMATVGYAFPAYQSIQCSSTALSKSLSNINKNVISYCNAKSNKTIFSSKGQETKQNLEKCVQAQANEFPFLTVPDTEIFLPTSREKTSDNTLLNSKTDKLMKIEEENNELINRSNEYNKTNDVIIEKTDSIDYTTSLDMLVGLLNEIQKITCQTQIDAKDDVQSKELGTILNNAAVLEDAMNEQPNDLISVASINKQKQIELSPSIYSYNLPNNNEQETRNNLYDTKLPKSVQSDYMPEYADKEVNVEVTEKQFVNTFTDVPSSLFPIAVNHSTNVTNSLMGILSKPSTHSMFSIKDYHVIYSNDSSSNCQKKIIELSSVVDSNDCIVQYQNIEEVSDKDKLPNSTIKMTRETNLINSIQKTLAYSITSSKFDPLIKIKRDILVALYSMLVLTVFAALSFPEILYHT